MQTFNDIPIDGLRKMLEVSQELHAGYAVIMDKIVGAAKSSENYIYAMESAKSEAAMIDAINAEITRREKLP